MGLPKRPDQYKAENRSYDILKYKLGALGIFRPHHDNDYGIDFELEPDRGGVATGRSIKVQVKSGRNLKPRADGVLTVSNIKQFTLEYWCTISSNQNVLAFAIDLASEKIYATADLFWQATRLMDGGETTKSITFVPPGKDDIAVAAALTAIHFIKPNAGRVVAAHKIALRELKSFRGLLSDAYQYDAGTELDPTITRTFLEVAGTLLWSRGDDLWTDQRDKARWHDYDYWVAKSEADNWDGLACLPAQPMLSTLIPALMQRLAELHDLIMAGAYYWAHSDPKYLEIVFEAPIPELTDHDPLVEFYHDFDRRGRVPTGSGSYFVYKTRLAVPAPKRKRKMRAAKS